MAGKETDGSAKRDILRDFVKRKKKEEALTQTRQKHSRDAFEMLENFPIQIDMDDFRRRVLDYKRKSGNEFGVHFSGLASMPGGYQYPFVDVDGKKLAIREMVGGEGRRDSAGSGIVTEYSLVIADGSLEGPEERDCRTGDIAGEAVFATIPGTDGTIDYHDEEINSDVSLAEAADREVIGHLRAVDEGMLEMLGDPTPVASGSN